MGGGGQRLVGDAGGGDCEKSCGHDFGAKGVQA